MAHKKLGKKKTKKAGIESIVEPGVGALYVRGPWMKKLGEVSKQKKLKKLLRKR